MTMLLAICLYFLIQIPSYGLDTNFTYSKTDGGVILRSKEKKSENTEAVNIQIISNRICRSITSQQKTLSATLGLIYIYDASGLPTWDIIPSNQEKLTLKTQFLKVFDDASSRYVPFLNSIKNYGITTDNYESAQNLNKKEDLRITCTREKQIVHLRKI